MTALALSPRGWTREQAAEHCGVSRETFSRWVRAGRMPGPISGTKRWDRVAIERAWNKLSGLDAPAEPASAYEAWKAQDNARAA